MNALILDHLTLTASLVLVLLGILTPMLNPFFRFRKKQQYSQESLEEPAAQPSVSLILTPYDDTDKLEKNLPYFLQQNYSSDYQVVIVIEQGDHQAEDIISRTLNATDLSESHAEVYVTCIPKTSRYVSKKKLAITLGIKAAKHDWVLVTESSCRPASPQWLSLMARHCNGDNNLVIGYGRYDDSTPSFRRFERLHTSCYLMHEYTQGVAYRMNSYNLLMRKNEFMDQGGFLGNLHLVRGEYDFLVNKYASKGTTAIETDEGAWLIEDQPSNKKWLNKHLYYMKSRKFLERGARHRMMFNVDQTAMHLTYLLLLAGIIYAILAHNWILLGASAGALLCNLAFRLILCRRDLNDFDEQISAVKALFYEMSLIWRNAGYMMRYRFADKYDFTTHKL